MLAHSESISADCGEVLRQDHTVELAARHEERASAQGIALLYIVVIEVLDAFLHRRVAVFHKLTVAHVQLSQAHRRGSTDFGLATVRVAVGDIRPDAAPEQEAQGAHVGRVELTRELELVEIAPCCRIAAHENGQLPGPADVDSLGEMKVARPLVQRHLHRLAIVAFDVGIGKSERGCAPQAFVLIYTEGIHQVIKPFTRIT